MRAGRRKQKVLRPRKEEPRAATSPRSPRPADTELPELPSRPATATEVEDVLGDSPAPAEDDSSVDGAKRERVEEPKDSQLPTHTLSDKQREAEMEAKTREARALVEERRTLLEQQESRRRQQEEAQRRRKRRERHNRKKRTDNQSIECSNKGPGSGSDETHESDSDGDRSFEESSQEENPFELCYNTEKEGAKVESDISHKPNIVGYQCQEEPTKRRIEDNYKGIDNWEQPHTSSSLTSCWSGVVSQLCGSSQLWMNLPLVSMFAYDPVPDAHS